jgi:hypothetical protein
MAAVLAAPAAAQSWGVGGTAGLVNRIDRTFTLGGFNRSEATAWVDYRVESQTLLRLTYGSMRTRASNSQLTLTIPGGGGAPPASVTLPAYKERIEYLTVGASYLIRESFYTSGLFAGIGGYHLQPDAVAPAFAPFRDLNEKVFGWHVGLEGELRLVKYLGLVARLTYHNIAAHPHRQFVNADAGLAARF